MNAGIIASVIANCNRDSKRKPEPFAPSDFMPKFGRREDPEDDGLAPDKVMGAMERLMAYQERYLEQQERGS